MKVCDKCGNEKPDEDYIKRMTGNIDTICIECLHEKDKEWDKKIGSGVKEALPKGYPKKRKKYRSTIQCYQFTGTPIPYIPKYGLSIAQQKQLYDQQHGRCAICNQCAFLVLDHNHISGVVRGYICRSCNNRLTGFDCPHWSKLAQAYLDNPPANIVR